MGLTTIVFGVNLIGNSLNATGIGLNAIRISLKTVVFCANAIGISLNAIAFYVNAIAFGANAIGFYSSAGLSLLSFLALLFIELLILAASLASADFLPRMPITASSLVDVKSYASS